MWKTDNLRVNCQISKTQSGSGIWKIRLLFFPRFSHVSSPSLVPASGLSGAGMLRLRVVQLSGAELILDLADGALGSELWEKAFWDLLGGIKFCCRCAVDAGMGFCTKCTRGSERRCVACLGFHGRQGHYDGTKS